MPKIKICAVTTISKTMDWFIVDNMRNLSKCGYEITLICNMDQEFISRNCDYANCIDIKMNRGVSIYDLVLMPLKLSRIFKKNEFDIVYYMTPNAAFYASLGGKIAGVKHRVYSQAGLRYVTFTGIKRISFKTIEKLTCGMSTTIRAQSFMNMKFAIDEKLCKKQKVSVVGIGGTTGVELESCDCFNHEESKVILREKYDIPLEALVYGFVGRINKDKGIEELIIAFEELYAKYSNIYLVLIGMEDDNNPVSSEIMKRAEENTHIVLLGNKPAKEIYKHMAIFDVQVHPTYREGFGKVLQEAMGMSVPIITTNVPGPCEVVEDGISGILVEVKDSKSLREAMENLYTNLTLRKSIAVAGRKRAEEYFDRPIMLNNLLIDMNKIVGK